MRHHVGHFRPYSTWEAPLNGALALKLDVHINIGFIIVGIYFQNIQESVRVNGPVSGEW